MRDMAFEGQEANRLRGSKGIGRDIWRLPEGSELEWEREANCLRGSKGTRGRYRKAVRLEWEREANRLRGLKRNWEAASANAYLNATTDGVSRAETYQKAVSRSGSGKQIA